MVYSTYLGEFCDFHSYDWEERLSQEPYNLKIKRDDPYVMFSYNQLSSDFNNEIVREARGIIFREGFWTKPVCHAFDKFGNYGESYVPEIDWETAKATEKVDGSLIKLWYDDFQWHISTNGTINAFDAKLNNIIANSFGDLFIKYFTDNDLNYKSFTQYLDQDKTYIFEMVSPYNRVVVPYDTLQLYFLGSRSRNDLKVVPFHEDTPYFMDYFHIKTPKVFSLVCLDDCITAASELPWDEEGYVVDDYYGNRVKIKSPSYVTAHYARTTKAITREHLIDIILQNEVSEFLVYASEYTENINQIKQDIQNFKTRHSGALFEMQLLQQNNHFENKREFAEWVKSQPKNIQPYLFNNYDNCLSFEEYVSDWKASKWEKFMYGV